MMCRRIHEFLSAYIDGELSESESIRVQEHLDQCACCCNELESLRQTKRLLGELARQRPRAELERLLVIEARRAELRPASPWDGLRRLAETPVRPRAALATAALSLAALWAATTRLSPTDDATRSRPLPPGTVIGQLPIVDREGTVVGSYLLVTQPTPRPRLRLLEPPRFLNPESPGLLTASWTSEPHYEAMHFTINYPHTSLEQSPLCSVR
jgi:hypothetical protein